LTATEHDLGCARAPEIDPPGLGNRAHNWESCPFVPYRETPTPRTVVADYPANFEPDQALRISMTLPMVSLTLKPWEGLPLEHTFGHKSLVNYDGTAMFAELAIQRMAAANGWSARWVCVYGAKATAPRFLTDWLDAPLRDQKVVVIDKPRQDLLNKIRKQNHGSYSGCWDVLAWKGERTVFIESKRNKKDHIRATQLEWRWAGLRAGVTADSFVVAQWEFA